MIPTLLIYEILELILILSWKTYASDNVQTSVITSITIIFARANSRRILNLIRQPDLIIIVIYGSTR